MRPAVDGLEGDVQPEVLAGVAVRDALHRLHGICTAAALSRRAKDENEAVARTERGGVADERRDVCPRAIVVPHIVLAGQRVRVQALVHPTPLVTLGAAEVPHVRFEAAIDEKVIGRLPTHMAFPQEMALERCGFEFLREDCELKRREVGVGAGLLAGDAGEESPGDEAAPRRGAPHVSAHSNQHLEKRSGRVSLTDGKKLWQGQEKCWWSSPYVWCRLSRMPSFSNPVTVGLSEPAELGLRSCERRSSKPKSSTLGDSFCVSKTANEQMGFRSHRMLTMCGGVLMPAGSGAGVGAAGRFTGWQTTGEGTSGGLHLGLVGSQAPTAPVSVGLSTAMQSGVPDMIQTPLAW